ncbi:signal peptidase II [Ruficoccus amylovorans]|uniref:Lipoprotein signal peptidase n=1 Tax=Ruficoccus amylovorans TaxID=1804625 RepID=A0A842HD49_9BACT|nr:signal peptidase II [Ruficoccus amylovorans]MBC2594160.1 signal peptidase II [Ruficoccus amylovorans]
MNAARLRPYRLLLVVALLVLVVDQITKLIIVEWLPVGTYFVGSSLPPVIVIPDFFYLVHITNKGAAWGMFEGYTLVLGLLGVVALYSIFHYRATLGLKRPLMQVAFGLLIGGIIGNMIDRFAYKHVVDFIDLHFGSYRYPSFNIADCGITIGVGLYILATILDAWKARKNGTVTEG